VDVDRSVVSAHPGQRISLAALDLPAGSHEINVGEAVLRFATTHEFRDATPPGAGSLGEILTPLKGSYSPASAGAKPLARMRPGQVAISGAHLVGEQRNLPSSRPTLLLPLNGHRYRLVGARPGEIAELKQPNRPEWMASAGHGALYPIGFEVNPVFDVVWIIIERPGRTLARLRELAPPAQVTGVTPSLAINDWCAVFDLEPALDGHEAACWLEYAAVAADLPKLTAVEIARLLEERRKPAEGASARRVARRAEPKQQLVVEHLLSLPLKYKTSDRHVYESRDKRFEVTYWTKAQDWTATERRDEKQQKGDRLGRFATEDDALAAVRKAIHTIRTVKRKASR
jgi:hypothetical protein